MKAIDRLRQLAGPGGTTGAALKRIGGTGNVAGALLVAYSGLASGSAGQHLLADSKKLATGGIVFRPIHLPKFNPALLLPKVPTRNRRRRQQILFLKG